MSSITGRFRLLVGVLLPFALLVVAPVNLAHSMPMPESTPHGMDGQALPSDCTSLCNGQFSADVKAPKSGVRIEEEGPSPEPPYYLRFATSSCAMTETARPCLLSYLLWRPSDLITLHASYLN